MCAKNKKERDLVTTDSNVAFEDIWRTAQELGGALKVFSASIYGACGGMLGK